MSQYYYLMAQLPSIDFGSVPPFKYEEFKELVGRFVSKKDGEVISSLSLEPSRKEEKVASLFLQKWYDFERTLRLALRELRANSLKWDDVDVSYQEHAQVLSSVYISNIASQAFAMEDPLQAELFLDKKRFEFLNNIKSADYFSSDSLFAYAIMLLIIIRESSFSKEIGEQEYKRLYSEILQQQ